MSQDSNPAGEVTGLLQRLRTGDEKAADQLFPLVYDELRRAAQRALRREREDHTLRPTELVHEAWFKLAGPTPEPLHNRAHFLGVAARAMRQVFVSPRSSQERRKARRGLLPHHDRRTGAGRGDAFGRDSGVGRRADSPGGAGAAAPDRRGIRVISRTLTDAEIGELLGVSERTVHRDWLKARAWLYKELYPSK